MFRCSGCFHVNFSIEELLCKFCGNEGATGAAGVEVRKLCDFQNINFGSNEPEENALTANEANPYSSFEIVLASLDEYLLESNSTADSEAPTHTIEIPFSRSHGGNELCDTVRTSDLNLSSPLVVLTGFNMPSGSTDQQFLKDTVHILDEKRINENSPPPEKSKSEIYAETFQGISNEGEQLSMHYDEAMKMDATRLIIIDNNHSPSPSRESFRVLFDTGSYTGQAALFLDVSAVSDPSGIQRNVNTRNLCVETSKSTYSNKLCNVCKKEYTEEYLPKNENKCSVCNKKFRCRTLYNEHLLDHPDYFKARCWVCLH